MMTFGGGGPSAMQANAAAGLPHAGVPGSLAQKVDEVLKRGGIERKVCLTVPHFVAIGHILQATDLIATVPQRLAQRMVDPFGLVVANHPATLPEVAINVFWHAKYHKLPANQWLRSLVFDLFSA